MNRAIQIDKIDNVATTTTNIENGEIVEILSSKGDVINKLKTSEAILFGHKISLSNLNIGDQIIKYGEVIGLASKPNKVSTAVYGRP